MLARVRSLDSLRSLEMTMGRGDEGCGFGRGDEGCGFGRSDKGGGDGGHRHWVRSCSRGCVAMHDDAAIRAQGCVHAP